MTKYTKKKVSIICLTMIMAGVVFLNLKKNKSATTEDISILKLENVEALASGEGGTPVLCYGSGSVDCSGIKVYMTISR